MRKTKQADGKFAHLFKKYRLRSEFETLAEFGDAMSERGLVYENSLYSRWQKGTRVPGDRQVLLAMVKVYMKRGGIMNLKEANAFLEAAGQGYLTDSEIEKLPVNKFKNIPFQSPREIDNFSGREDYISFVRELLLQNKSVLLWGGAGVGKTSLAIKLAHFLRSEFTDGVIWCRLDTSNTMNILASIGYAYGEDISGIKDLASRASIIRSLLSGKKVLLILDNAERDSEIELIMPNSSSCAVIVTSQDKTISLHFDETVSLNHFTDKESFSLYAKILGDDYVKTHTYKLEKIVRFCSNLPLALHIIAKQIKDGQISIDSLMKRIEAEKIKLSDFSYQSKDLYAVLNARVAYLNEQQKKLFYSLGIFGGKDFSLEPVAFVNGIKKVDLQVIIHQLINFSLIEYSVGNRYRIHPFIRLYLQERISDNSLYKKAAIYYTRLLHKGHNADVYFYNKIHTDLEIVYYIYKKLHLFGYLDEIIKLGWDLGVIFWNRGYWADTLEVAKTVYSVAKKTNNYKAQALICIREFSWVYYWTGDLDKALKYTNEGLELAERNKDEYMIAYAKERLGRLLLGKQRYKEALIYLNQAYEYFKIADTERRTNCERYLGETYMFLHDYVTAEKYLENTLEHYENIKRIPLRNIYQSIVTVHIGVIRYHEKNYQLAEDSFMRSITLRENGGRGWANLWAFLGIALVYEKVGDIVQATDYFKKAHEEMLFLGISEKQDNVSVFFANMRQNLASSKLYNKVFRSLV